MFVDCAVWGIRVVRKIVMYLLLVGMLLSVYDSFENYMINGDDFSRDPQVMYEIYDELPIPDNTKEIERKEFIRKRYSLSLYVYYHTSLPDEDIRQFYIEKLVDKGWQQIED
ncbi:hypothetical protein FZ041_02940 [Selenomonas caprae]|uniref:Uncharacterized protein n=1 Tax=Selenomonas caprae TaxID=2606905 RepID=A0A5D6WNW3_9FIRM|nr:hypothetical protein [Selenomonas caprae]TYZ30251.1 hypothetical protein FZ041_02940 [Selenomonas caprae]